MLVNGYESDEAGGRRRGLGGRRIVTEVDGYRLADRLEWMARVVVPQDLLEFRGLGLT